MKALEAGDTVDYNGISIRVIRGEHPCSDEDCGKAVVTICDPETDEADEVHVEDLAPEVAKSVPDRDLMDALRASLDKRMRR